MCSTHFDSVKVNLVFMKSAFQSTITLESKLVRTLFHSHSRLFVTNS